MLYVSSTFPQYIKLVPNDPKMGRQSVMQARLEEALHGEARMNVHKAAAQAHEPGSVRTGPRTTGKAAAGAPCIADDVLQEAVEAGAVEAADAPVSWAGQRAHWAKTAGKAAAGAPCVADDVLQEAVAVEAADALAEYHELGSVRTGPQLIGKAAAGAPCIADDVLQEAVAVAVEAADALAGRPAHHRAHLARQRQVAPHGVHKLGQLHA